METLREETSVAFQTKSCKIILDLETHFCGVLPYLFFKNAHVFFIPKNKNSITGYVAPCKPSFLRGS